MRFLAALSALLTLAVVLVPTWWWAVAGMSADVGTAWFITDCIAVPLGCLATFGALTASDEAANSGRRPNDG